MKLISTFRTRLRQYRWLIDQFRGLLWSQRALFALSGAALAGEILFQVLGPWPLMYLTDGILAPREDRALRFVPDGFVAEHPAWFVAAVCAAMVLIAVCGQWCAYHRTVWSATAGQRMVMKLRKRLYDHLHRLPIHFHRESRLGDLILRITGDVPVLRDVLSESLMELVARIGAVAVILSVMFWVDPVLASVSVVVLAVLGSLSLVSGRKMVQVVRKQRKRESEVAFAAGETLRSVALIKAYGREDEVTRRFARTNRASLRAGLKGTRIQAGLTRWVEILFALGTATILGLGVYRMGQEGGPTAGVLLAFLSYVRHLNKPLRKLSRISARIGKAAACGERLVEILALPAEQTLDRGTRDATGPESSIRFEGVSMAYEPERAALDGVDLEIRAGERLAVVGPNGAGKSTLMNLMLRFYNPTGGRVTLDGADLQDLRLESLRARFTLVLQDTHLFSGTIRDNVLFSAPDAGDAEILGVLRRVGADFVDRLPQGLDTELTESGVNLSGGERRKLFLAAALLRQTPVLVLDEPTTFVDGRSRDDILAALPALTVGTTTVVITHDPALLDWMDRVVYLQAGRVLAAGSHQELLQRCGEYRRMFHGGLEAAQPAVEP